jgi:hypothetical protein
METPTDDAVGLARGVHLLLFHASGFARPDSDNVYADGAIRCALSKGCRFRERDDRDAGIL